LPSHWDPIPRNASCKVSFSGRSCSSNRLCSRSRLSASPLANSAPSTIFWMRSMSYVIVYLFHCITRPGLYMYGPELFSLDNLDQRFLDQLKRREKRNHYPKSPFTDGEQADEGYKCPPFEHVQNLPHPLPGGE